MFIKLNHNLSISRLCFGCEALGGNDWGKIDFSVLSQAINTALELGVNFFDVADVYGLGLAETNLSKYLGSKRHDSFIATKIGVRWNDNNTKDRANTFIDNAPTYLDKAIKACLERLRIDQLPLCYLHWPDNDNYTFSKAVERLGNYIDKSIVRYLGLSNINFEQLKIASSIVKIDFIQIPANILNKPIDNNILEYCLKNNIKIVAYNVLNSGLLSGNYEGNSSFASNDRRARLEDFQGARYKNNLQKVKHFKKIATENSLSLSQYSIRKLLDTYKTNNINVIVGIKNSKQLYENLLATHANPIMDEYCI